MDEIETRTAATPDRAHVARSLGMEEGFVKIASVLKPALIVSIFLLAGAWAQQAEKKPAESQSGQPQIKLNYLNVCAPSAEEQSELKSALTKVQVKPAFGRDFEVARGRATMQDSTDSKFVRLRRDLATESPLMTAQYSMSTDPANTIETLVLRMRDPREFHEISLEDRVSSGATPPSAVLQADTPVSRIRLERFSKGSVVLSRCKDADQSAYEPLFRQASEIMAEYRKALGLRSAFHSDIAWLSAAEQPAGGTPAKAAQKHK